jgi:hypothetical protein
LMPGIRTRWHHTTYTLSIGGSQWPPPTTQDGLAVEGLQRNATQRLRSARVSFARRIRPWAACTRPVLSWPLS